MIFMLAACDSKPKVIEAVDATEETTPAAADPAASQLHKVVVDEVLHTSKYTYLNVTEDGVQSWIAIPKKEVKVGGTYYYRGGLKKTNFKSVEYDRVFETLYLVSDVSEDPGMSAAGSGSSPHAGMGSDEPQLEQTTKLDPPPGGISIAELIKNKQKYEGQTVRVKGRCVKLNNMIMSRNWIHLQDGSMGDQQVDLTVTTTENVQLGSVVAFEGKITLNKDFGAGYKYDIIMEEAHLLQ
jgi:starvation-inducible outer membrane lipoprotein